MKNNQLIYSLTVDQEIERDLLPDEIEKIIDAIAEKINWYDAIADSIIKKRQFVYHKLLNRILALEVSDQTMLNSSIKASYKNFLSLEQATHLCL